jgi:wobble nucleotide-excising tRNase
MFWFILICLSSSSVCYACNNLTSYAALKKRNVLVLYAYNKTGATTLSNLTQCYVIDIATTTNSMFSPTMTGEAD